MLFEFEFFLSFAIKFISSSMFTFFGRTIGRLNFLNNFSILLYILVFIFPYINYPIFSSFNTPIATHYPCIKFYPASLNYSACPTVWPKFNHFLSLLSNWSFSTTFIFIYKLFFIIYLNNSLFYLNFFKLIFSLYSKVNKLLSCVIAILITSANPFENYRSDKESKKFKHICI